MNERREVILSALREAGDAGISGEVLAESLGVSRAAVAKHITALRDFGYEIKAARGAGYVLAAVPDTLLVHEIAPLLRSGFWTRIETLPETGSTNDVAKTLARAGAGQGTVVLASRQSAGRGRLGRSWMSPDGGIYLSAVLRPQTPLAEISALPLVIAIGVARGLAASNVGPRLKWPNDVYLDDAGVRGDERGRPSGKVAGVLLEMAAESDRAEWVVAGVGINVKAPVQRFAGAAYLDDHLIDPLPVSQVAAHVLDHIAGVYREFSVAGFASLAAEYRQLSLLEGCDVTVTGMDGAVRARGRAMGVDLLGRLVVAQPDGETLAVSSGDVTLRRTEH